MKILVTGANGYIGNPLSLQLLNDNIHDCLLVDSGMRDKWVKEVGGCSLTEYPQAKFLYCNIANSQECLNVLQYFQPDVIIHLASQPSGPYSEISLAHRTYTQTNNLQMLLNLLTGSHELGLNPKFIVTTTTGIPGAPGDPIIEGQTPNLAGSAYHASRGFDTANLALAVKQWKFRVLELRTSIVYGIHTDLIDEPVTRFDWDFFFGTAVHRFCLMRRMNKPITIYGKGLQKKPFISLRDMIESLINAIDYEVSGHEIMNQTTGAISIVDVAKEIGGAVEHIPNPRVENEEHQMIIHNSKFLKLLKDNHSPISYEAKLILKHINPGLLPSYWEQIYAGKL